MHPEITISVVKTPTSSLTGAYKPLPAALLTYRIMPQRTNSLSTNYGTVPWPKSGGCSTELPRRPLPHARSQSPSFRKTSWKSLSEPPSRDNMMKHPPRILSSPTGVHSPPPCSCLSRFPLNIREARRRRPPFLGFNIIDIKYHPWRPAFPRMSKIIDHPLPLLFIPFPSTCEPNQGTVTSISMLLLDSNPQNEAGAPGLVFGVH